MTFLVPFDGSYLAEAALMRASEYGKALDEDVIALSVIPDDEAYATSVGWYESGESEPFSVSYVAKRLREGVDDIAPGATFREEQIDDGSAAAIATRITDVADEIRPSVVFLGTENVGEIAQPVTSVAGGVAANATYDVHIVRYYAPPEIPEIQLEEGAYQES
ncbi:universal stress protein [Natronorubrum thiooxidans]|uniref:Universal stress protein family protein n=1 Tax=Natronorubrum thiooxidans TaxID=308853 RepID=A0A1N7DJI5_9EURY|nr:universal stress protein [Natronorubrum thiooxidans]SIR75958.1 Universal stress protein family protein [Natronorubrum thiooxidans]